MNVLTAANERAVASNTPIQPVKHTKLIRLQDLWNKLFPKRRLEIGGFFPTVKRLDATEDSPPYHLRQMSDGERTVLYMAARVLTAENPVILVDEPELHMHSRLSVQFWDEAEKLRPDCRFVYITHDLSFTLSRRRARVLSVQANETLAEISIDGLPSSAAAEILGAATLPFHAKRIVFFEGEAGKGFASEFFSAWFADEDTFVVPAGNRDSVCAAVSGLAAVGVVGASVTGLIDRDFYSNEVLAATTAGVSVLPLHEVESVLCDKKVVTALAIHFGKDSDEVWSAFLDRVRSVFSGKTMNDLVAKRVRSRVGDLMKGAFSGDQIDDDFDQTSANHARRFSDLDLPRKTLVMFIEERERVEKALALGDETMLAILPGKHLLNLLPKQLGLNGTPEVLNLVIRALDRKPSTESDSLRSLGAKVEGALLAYLPPRKA